MAKHLKDRQHYIDLYDRHTVERCRSAERSFNEDDVEPIDLGEEKYTKEQAVHLHKMAKDLYLHLLTGERAINKDQAIREWMEADKQKDDLLENTEAPEGIRCLTCRNVVKPTFKELWSEMDKPDRVLFMYDCPNKCMPRRAFFSDGEEWRPKPRLCPRCQTPLDMSTSDDETKLVTTNTCPQCGYSQSDEYEWTHKKEDDFDPNFAKDRDRFCLTDEDSQKFYSEKIGMQQAGKLMEEIEAKEKARAEKLKANPRGFHLEGAGYRCAICGDSTPEGDNWYDEYGIKCLICQKAIDDGEIPAVLAKDKESWYSTWDLDHFFNLKSMTLRSWVKKEIIKARIVSRYGKGIHTELFLIEDNKDFLPPKKMLEGKGVRYIDNGKEYFTTRKWYEFQDPMELLKDYGIIKHMRVIPPEEMKAREEERKRKWEERRSRREQIKKVRNSKKRSKK